MEFYLILISIVCLYVFLLHFFPTWFHTKRLPPGPPTIPFIGNIFWLLKSSQSFSSLEPILRRLRDKYGPIVTLHIGTQPAIFITAHEAAHRALVRTGSLFASRPHMLETSRVVFSDYHTLSTAPYGPIWRVLRQNFMSVIHPSRLHLYSSARKQGLQILKNRLLAESKSGQPVVVVEHFHRAMFFLISYICFGEKFEDEIIRDIEQVQRASLHNFIRFNVLNYMPVLGKIVFRKLWKELLEIRQNQEKVLLPLIKARAAKKKKEKIGEPDDCLVSYVDTLLDLKLPDGEKDLTDGELVSLVAEFINSGSDTSTTALQWLMANLVKHQEIQEKLVNEINKVVRQGDEIKAEDLEKMPYLKAIVLETLRRHPPGHFTLPRAVTEDTKLDGYDIPKNASVNFAVAEMSWDSSVWEDPMEFKPDRFLKSDDEVIDFDLKCVKEIKMMPFGAGRRVCPAITMALLHQQYYVANLIRDFKWTAENVDFSEKQDFTTGMKNPLRVHIFPRVCN